MLVQDDFEDVADSVGADGRGRITLGTAAKDKQFRVSRNKIGQILLTPVVTIPEHEMWLWRNPEALAMVQRGLEQSAAGQGKVMDFSQYLNLEVDE